MTMWGTIILTRIIDFFLTRMYVPRAVMVRFVSWACHSAWYLVGTQSVFVEGVQGRAPGLQNASSTRAQHEMHACVYVCVRICVFPCIHTPEYGFDPEWKCASVHGPVWLYVLHMGLVCIYLHVCLSLCARMHRGLCV